MPRRHRAQDLERNPLDGSLYVFLDKRRDRVKLLQRNGNGLWLHYERLGEGTFQALAGGPPITRAELAMLLEGIEVKKGMISRRFADSLRRAAVHSGDESIAVVHVFVGPLDCWSRLAWRVLHKF